MFVSLPYLSDGTKGIDLGCKDSDEVAIHVAVVYCRRNGLRAS